MVVSHDSEKYQQEQVEERQVAARPGFGQKYKRHCARFWWIHVIVFCVIFLIITLCLVYVAMPKIAQQNVDESSLEFTELQFLDPSPESITLTQRSTLKNPSIYTPTLDSFNASFYVVTNGTVGPERILYITLPEIHATKPESFAVIESQKLKIESVDQLTEFATQVLKSEEVETKLMGSTTLHLGKLPDVTVNYNEVTKYKGLNGLKGFNTTGLRVNLTAPAGTRNLRGFAYIPNPSVMTIAMGNVTLSLSTEKAGVVGKSTILDMTLKPGNNTLPMFGTVDQQKLLGSLNPDSTVTMTITGESAIYNGEHLVYYEKALASNNLTLIMDIGQVLRDSTLDP